MSAKPIVAVLIVLVALATRAAAQPRPAPDLPVRLSWGAINQDGYATVTFTNDTSLAITAWALGVSIVRPDGSTVVRPGSRADFWAGLVGAQTRPGAPAGGPVFLPSVPYTHPVKVGAPSEIADFSVFITAAVFEDGSVVGNRDDVAMFLASREIDATTADAWRAVFESAANEPDRTAAVGLLQQAIDGGAPAVRVGGSLRNLAQTLIRERAEGDRWNAALEHAIRTARAYADGGRRHLNPGSRLPHGQAAPCAFSHDVRPA